MADNEESGVKKLAKKGLGAITAPLGGLAGAALLGTQPGVKIKDAAKFGAKAAYHTATGDKEATRGALDEFVKETKNRQAREVAADSAESDSNSDKNTMRKGGKVKSASARADGCCIRGKTRA